MNNLNKILVVSLTSIALSSCASNGFLAKKFGYTPDKYVPKDQIDQYVAKNYKSLGTNVAKTKYTTKTVPISSHAVMTSFGMSQSPEILKAYNNYVSGSVNSIVHSDGYTTYPFDPYNRPIFKCSVGRVCTIALEAGEQIIGKPSVGDSVHWKIDVGIAGQGNQASQMLIIKPLVVAADISKNNEVKYFSTNLIIPTNKRVYNIGLLSTPANQNTSVMNFYYPNETSQKLEDEVKKLNSKTNAYSPSTQTNYETNVDFNNINPEKYHIVVKSKDIPNWKPVLAFDDGNKTFLKLPSNTNSYQLPAVWVERQDGKKELSSANVFHKPYFIIDGTYKNIFLFGGSDKEENAQEVEISKD